MGNLNELDKFWLRSYESSVLCKESVKVYHEKKIKEKLFQPSEVVL